MKCGQFAVLVTFHGVVVYEMKYEINIYMSRMPRGHSPMKLRGSHSPEQGSCISHRKSTPQDLVITDAPYLLTENTPVSNGLFTNLITFVTLPVSLHLSYPLT